MTKGGTPATAALIAWLVFMTVEASTVELFELQHRNATEIIPLINPLLGPGDSLSNESNRLMVRASPQTLAKLRKIIASLDRPLHNLLITVRKVPASSLRFKGAPDTENKIPKLEAPVTRTTGKHLTTRHEGLGSHQVRIVEGQQAFIRSEQTSARPNWIVVYPPYGFVTGGGTEYGATEGYYVTPRLSGNQVVLDIRHQQRSADGRGDSSLHTSELSVRVQGRLGEWMRIGAALGPDTVRDTDQHKRIARTASAEYAVEVKVESVNR